jgi:chromosome condensin MukBEF ATPase and DNA-binding subunit MukB
MKATTVLLNEEALLQKQENVKKYVEKMDSLQQRFEQKKKLIEDEKQHKIEQIESKSNVTRCCVCVDNICDSFAVPCGHSVTFRLFIQIIFLFRFVKSVPLL